MELQDSYRADAVDGTVNGRRFAELSALSHSQAAELADAGGCSANWGEITQFVHAHPLHSQVILQSAFIRHALMKPRGYPGDMDLMRMICSPAPAGPTVFAQELNRVYLNLPAAQAVRDRVATLGNMLDELPHESRVLNLACGPALEVQRHYAHRPDSTLTMDLLDHDPQTLAYLRPRVPPDRVTTVRANAFRIMAGDLTGQVMPPRPGPSSALPRPQGVVLRPSYDLIYSAGLYDYLPDSAPRHLGAADLTRVLFNLLRPGGLLVIGNYLRPDTHRPHRLHHRAMMEIYSRWSLHYRDQDDLQNLTTSLPPRHSLELLDENGHPVTDAASVIGFAHIRAL